MFHKIYKRLPPQDKVNYIIIEHENICENWYNGKHYYYYYYYYYYIYYIIVVVVQVGYIGKSELHNKYGHATNSQGGKRDANYKGFKSSLCESNEPKLDSISQTKHPLNIRGYVLY